jgi:Na+-transporting NADH:ubiquinone oxidoreductase subunit A
MPKEIKLRKGFDIKLLGKAEKNVVTGIHPDTYAFKPTDFLGIARPKVMVNPGDLVKAGTPIFFDKMNPAVRFTAPVSGEVVEVKRGDKRAPLEIVILADKEIEYLSFNKYTSSALSSLSAEDAKAQMLESGVWPHIIQRPFGVIANPEQSPKAIFISTFDTHPVAPDYAFALKGEEQYFQAGLTILQKFTKGKVHLNLNGQAEAAPIFNNAQGVEINKFSGKHPAGNVGVQIHHIAPINKGDLVWTVSPTGVAQIGKLFLEGKYDASKVIALAGPEVSKPQYYRVISGANIKKVIENNLKSPEKDLRFVSGNVLTGERIPADGYLGFYHQMITVLKEGKEYDFLGWILPTSKTSRSLSFHRALGTLSFLMPQKEYALTTNTHGEERAFVQTGVYEEVLPMDILPVYLLKAIMAQDFDAMEQLGIYEIIEEDIALCEFIDVSKINMQQILREGIDLILNS